MARRLMGWPRQGFQCEFMAGFSFSDRKRKPPLSTSVTSSIEVNELVGRHNGTAQALPSSQACLPWIALVRSPIFLATAHEIEGPGHFLRGRRPSVGAFVDP